MKTVFKYFLQGLLYLAPISLTALLFIEIFAGLDSLIPLDIPGLGIILLFTVITISGVVGSYLIKLPLFNMIETQLERVPLIKLVYSSVKDLVKAFVGQKKGFNHPVLLKLYENSEIRRLGFITDEAQDLLEKKNLNGLLTVYVPHSFAISGQLFLVPESYVEPINSKSADVMKYIIAGGVVTMDDNDN